MFTLTILSGMKPNAAPKGHRGPDHRTRVGQERSARTASRIIEAASRVFADMGPETPKIDDFVRAAGISRGTFYNHFESVDELLDATSEWMTRGLIENIEVSLAGIDSPAVRFGVGLRLFFAKAKSDRNWSRFVARVWKVGGLALPAKDIESSHQLGVFRVPSTAVATDLIFGAVREALSRLGGEETPADYGEQMAELCMQALGADRRTITSAMRHELPPLEHTEEARS